MNNMDIYNSVASVPENAKKPITAGRLRGMTDINPMWRIKVLTETFGVVGFGWKYKITDKRIVDGANDTKCAFVDIDLFVKIDGEWSDAIQGTGGSSFIAAERNGLYTSDECFKMALTDAISVACKALGVGADVYWAADVCWTDGRTKYSDNTKQNNSDNAKQPPPAKPVPVCTDCGKPFSGCKIKDKLYDAYQVGAMAAKMSADGKPRCKECREKQTTETVTLDEL